MDGHSDVLLFTGGVLHDQLLQRQSPSSLRTVAAPKVAGLLNLGKLASAQPVTAFVPFSSIAALLGNAGQTNYSAANAAMDAWAGQKQEQVCLLSVQN